MPGRDLDRLTRRVAAVTGVAVRAARPLGGTGVDLLRCALDTGVEVAAKLAREDTPPGFLAAERLGLRWLGEVPGAPPVPPLLGADDRSLVLRWIAGTAPGRDAARRFGEQLAALHGAGAGHGYGAPWPGYIGPVPMDNSGAESWPSFYATRRIEPYLRMLRERAASTSTAVFDRLIGRLSDLAGPPEPPARLHGDLWSGNLIWGADGTVWLIDPAAHGGHRETDLAMLALFGAPFLGDILAGYQEAATAAGAPLATGWRDRVELHQLFPLLVHAVLFGSGYLDQAVAVARRYAG